VTSHSNELALNSIGGLFFIGATSSTISWMDVP
jgi:hypothetical protein